MQTAKCEICEVEVKFRTYKHDWPNSPTRKNFHKPVKRGLSVPAAGHMWVQFDDDGLV